MSLEAVIAAQTAALEVNTAAIGNLIAYLSQGVALTTEKPLAGANKEEAAAPVEKPKAAEQAAAPVAAPAEVSSTSAPVNAGAAATYDDAKTVVLAVSRTKGRQAALDILAQFGTDKLPDIDPSKYADVVAACNKVLGG